MTDASDPTPVVVGAVGDDDDDFGSFEDAVTGTEDVQPDESKSVLDNKASGSSSLAGVTGGDLFDSAHSEGESSSSHDKDKAGDSGGDGRADPAVISSLSTEGDAADDGARTDEKKEDEGDSPSSTQPTAAADPFGAFDSVPAISLPEITGGDGGDDPFAAFDTVSGATTSESQVLNGEAGVGAPVKDEVVGASRREVTAETAPEEASNRDDDDGFGSFDDAVMVESPEDVSATAPAQEGTEGDQNGDEFGAFSSTTPSEEAAPDGELPESRKREEVTHDADAPMEGNDKAEGTAGQGGNDFGDFGAFENAGASVEPAMEPVEANTASDGRAADSSDTKFGDEISLDGSPAPTEPALASPTEGGGEEKPSANKSVDASEASGHGDNVGDFGSFNEGPAESEVSEEAAMDAPTISKAEEEGASEDGVAVTEENGFGEFGDFNGGASELQNEEVKKVETKENGDEAAGMGDTSAGDDDFGDFGSFNDNAGPEETMETPSEMEAEISEKEEGDKVTQEEIKGGVTDDEDFGDFGSFNESPTTETAAEASVKKMNEKEEQMADGAAALEQVENPSEAAAQPSASGDNADVNNDDDDDDDFGDFGNFEAPAAPLVEEEKPSNSAGQPPVAGGTEDDDDDFGDFGDFDDAGGISEGAAPEPVLEDPLVTKARAVLERVFGGFPVDGASINSLAEDHGVGSETLESVLSSITAPPGDRGEGLWSKRQVESILSDLDGMHSAPPSVISNHDIPQPYSHYAIPMGGLHLSEDGSPVYGVDADGLPGAGRRRGNSRGGGKKPVVPDVLSINLPTGPESPPPPRKPPAMPTREAATVVALPGVKGEEKTGKARKAANSVDGTLNGEGDFDADFGGFASAQSGPENSATQGTSEGDGDFDPDFGGFESAKQPSGTAEGGNDSVIMSASCKDFLRQIPNLSFMLKSTLSLPTGSDRS
mmetsp:Transcript_17204/g.49823  ORF Transcript_17204/g.49823 Transcript_17204/m.49823 type:complete len:944 (-) Transcript_17204:237-3068(-)